MEAARPEAVVIGASAGALEALSAILPGLPADYPMPVIIVVHLPPDKESVLAELLQAKCRIRVCEAEDKEPLEPGVAYVAPPDYHLMVENREYLSISKEEPVLFSRPSIDVLFETAADVYEAGLIGVVLTGGNDDGASGLKAITEAGGRALVQDPATAYAHAMPQAAIAACPDAQVCSLEEIAENLRNMERLA
jgi:two-component system chemotaxis response regulator CheB